MERKRNIIIKMLVDNIIVEHKECSQCNNLLPLSEYHKAKRGLGGRVAKCKNCVNLYFLENKGRISENSRKYYQENKEKRLEYTKKYRKENPSKVNDWNKKAQKIYYYRNKETRLNNYKKWKKENPLKAQKNDMNWRTKRKLLPSILSYDELLELKNHQCVLTGDTNDIALDHFIAVSTGHGGTYLGNIIPLKSILNSSKHNKNPFDWINTRPDIDINEFNNVVKYLANLNKLTPDEYKNFVYWCFDNPRTIEQIKLDGDKTSLELWKESQYIKQAN
jgi:hypothetical protein